MKTFWVWCTSILKSCFLALLNFAVAKKSFWSYILTLIFFFFFSFFFFVKISPILNLKVGFLSTSKNFWNFLPKYRESPLSKLIMTEVSRNLRNIIFPKVPPILKLEVGFFSAKKKFFADFSKYGKFFFLLSYYERSFKKFAEHFLIIHHH